MDEARIKEMVRARYGGTATASKASCCAPSPSSCCSPETMSHGQARRMDYSEAELAVAPEVPISELAAAARRQSQLCNPARVSSISATAPVASRKVRCI